MYYIVYFRVHVDRMRITLGNSLYRRQSTVLLTNSPLKNYLLQIVN